LLAKLPGKSDFHLNHAFETDLPVQFVKERVLSLLRSWCS
jgi:hypothetical protein